MLSRIYSGEYDQISANGETVASSDTIELVSVSHTDETETEVIPKGVEYVDDATLIKGQEKSLTKDKTV